MEDLDRYGLMRHRSGVWRSLREGDFEEEDVWSVYKEKSTTSIDHSNNGSSSSAPRTVPKSRANSNSISGHEGSKNQSSAPVNVPNWSARIFRRNKGSKSSSSSVSWHDHYNSDDDDDDDDHDDDDHDHDEEGFDIDGVDYGFKLPPHEFIARRLAKSQISSFSVFEGAGRTLKGRDLSKVRNAVLTKTGFLESL